LTKTLLINCFLDKTQIKSLRDTIAKFSAYTEISYEKIQAEFKIDSDIDGVVISGSEARIVNKEDKSKFEEVTELIKKCNVPILAICFGHQLLCSAFGAKTGSLPEPVIDRFEQVRILQKCGLFEGFAEGQAVPLFQYHNDYVQKEGLEEAEFMLLADSATCEVEAVKHKTKPFYGCQFHPEDIQTTTETHPEGHKVIENFYHTL
jgi:GMP synthase (glutamine-hydrolysing)